MRKLAALIFLVCPIVTLAQNKNLFANIQLHYDFHRDAFVSTVELLELDRYGSAFFFTDFDYYEAGQTASYFEVSRNLSVLRTRPFVTNLSIQYNDGVLNIDALGGKQIPRTFLYGVALSGIHIGPAELEVQGLARQEFGVKLGYQFTGIWILPIPSTPVVFQGYVDWYNHNYRDQPTVVQSEPQMCVRMGQFAIGSELEVSRNFTGAYTKSQGFSYGTWYAHPTIFARVDF